MNYPSPLFLETRIFYAQNIKAKDQEWNRLEHGETEKYSPEHGVLTEQARGNLLCSWPCSQGHDIICVTIQKVNTAVVYDKKTILRE